ncbi:sugar kinase [uncultured Cohaesibacter sp.]|uniref:sugar kinase n=1 Tax=uncultured Cohaesibacter sp. TaxID=1002546 RepID=UPI0029C66D08|nr:sugar kinase [uncultured Cohaesibacter sp.]
MNKTVRLASIGECMIEFSPAGNGLYKQGFAGDTFNTAIYLSRQFSPRIEVSYVTGLGNDPQSNGIRKLLTDEGLKVDSITMVEDKSPGLYLIENDETGERFFQYWRNDAAAKKMFAGWSVDEIKVLLETFDLVYFSGITLAILDEAQRDNLFAALAEVKGKVQIGFDPNYRAKLWPDSDVCRAAYARAASLADLALVTIDDHQALWPDETAQAVADRWRQWGAREVVVKEGGANCIVLNDEGFHDAPPPALLKPKDTTGAGDSFAAGYLGMRALGHDFSEAAQMAHSIAGRVIMHPGAVIDPSLWTRVEL